MNIGSFLLGTKPFYGVFFGDVVTPVSVDFLLRYPTLRDVLDDSALDLMRQNIELNRPIALSDIRFLPPVPNPRKIICVGMNYRKPYPVDGVAPPGRSLHFEASHPLLVAKNGGESKRSERSRC